MLRSLRPLWGCNLSSISLSISVFGIMPPSEVHPKDNSLMCVLSIIRAFNASLLSVTFSNLLIYIDPWIFESSPSSLMLFSLSLPTTKPLKYCKSFNLLIPLGISFNAVPSISRCRKFIRFCMPLGSIVSRWQLDSFNVCRLYKLHNDSGNISILV